MFRWVLAVLLLAIAGAAIAQQPEVPRVIDVNTPPLVPYRIVGNTIPAPLTNQPGDPVRGKRVVTDATNGTCLICHTMPLPEEPNHGNIAPSLEGVGSRLTAAELRLRIVDAKRINPNTIMLSYYRLHDLTRVQQQYVGRTYYGAQDVEDAIAYLLTLK
jgi:sulfur-oxidizing protein SoxX